MDFTIKDGQDDTFRLNCLTYALILVALIFVYSPIIQNDFLFYDDYCFFTLNRGLQTTRITLGQARPFMGIVVDMLNTSSIMFSGLKRVVGVVGLSWVAMLLYHWLRRNGIQPFHAAILGLTACCLPSFLYTESYLNLAVLSYSTFFSGLSACVFLTTFEQESPSRLKRITAILVAAMLLFFSLSCYQLNAMFCWVIIVVTVALTIGSAQAKLYRNVLYYAVLFFLTLGIYNIFYKLLFRIYPKLSAQSGRSAMVGNIPELIVKIKWFLGVVIAVTYNNMVELLNSNLLVYPRIVKIVFILVCLAIFIPDIMGRKEPLRPVLLLVKGLLICVAIPLCYFPFLVLKENGAMVYYLSNLEAMFYLLFCIGLVNILCLIKRKGGGDFSTLLLLLLLFAVSFAANKNLMTKYAMPNTLEYRYVKGIVASSDKRTLNNVHVVGHLNFSDVLTYSELLVGGVLTDCGYAKEKINITSSSNSIPSILHPEIYNRHSFYEKFYIKNNIWGYYNVRTDLTEQEKATLLESIKSLRKMYSSQEDALVIDLSNLAYMY